MNIINDYLSIISTLESNYCSQQDVSPLAVKLLFRGMSDSEYTMLPSVMRGYKKYSREETILQRFIKEASVFNNDIAENDYYKWLELAQHYGAPTRLLDWSSNPLAALFFACSENPKKDARVWILQPFNYNRFKNSVENARTDRGPVNEVIYKLIRRNGVDDNLPAYPGLYVPSYIDQRMSNQSSYFMYWGTKEQALEEMIPEDHYMSAEQGAAGFDSACLFCYTIPAADKADTLRKLDQLGVNAKMIYPGMDGVGKYVKQFFQDDAN